MSFDTFDYEELRALVKNVTISRAPIEAAMRCERTIDRRFVLNELTPEEYREEYRLIEQGIDPDTFELDCSNLGKFIYQHHADVILALSLLVLGRDV